MIKQQFIAKANLKHQQKYDYSELPKIINWNSKVHINCAKHGIFTQSAKSHIEGSGCQKCARESRAKHAKIKLNNSKYSFKQRASTIHNNKYDYSKSIYVDNSTKITIICPTHGEFLQSPASHLSKIGCPYCAIDKRRKNTIAKASKNFIPKANKIHNNKYDYSKFIYKNIHHKSIIICPIHGEFLQAPKLHLKGKGCKKCGSKKFYKQKIKQHAVTFKQRASTIHNNKYDYSKSIYTGISNKIKIICPVHGEFWQLASNHLQNYGCQKCAYQHQSNFENEINNYINKLNIKTQRNCRNIISPKEIDIFIPSLQIAIECNGTYWHCDKQNRMNKNYHLNKTTECEKGGIHLIHIFEDEWTDKQHIVKSRLNNLLKNNKQQIYARQCKVQHISNNIHKNFLNNNHLLGSTNAKIKLGLFFHSTLIAIMSFDNYKPDTYELLRFCTIKNTSVVGGASKLFKTFISIYNPNSVISYADRCWTSELKRTFYDHLNFKLERISQPNYFYVKNQKRFHQSNFQKNKQIKKAFTESQTNEIMMQQGYVRIYDAGSYCYKWQKKH